MSSRLEFHPGVAPSDGPAGGSWAGRSRSGMAVAGRLRCPRWILPALLVLSLGLGVVRPQAGAASDPYRGLWVGQVSLSHVTEVPVPLDENNVPVAPNPRVPTPTADQAHLRLILHVNGAGQVNLLKDCAILSRSGDPNPGIGSGASINIARNPDLLVATSTGPGSESDLALVTDARLYGEFPPQPAVRFASAVFDFGEAQATRALEAVLDEVVDAVATVVQAASRNSLSTAAGQSALQESARLAGVNAANPVIAAAGVAEAFFSFRTAFLAPVQVTAIAQAAVPASSPEAVAAIAAAVALRDASVYGDTRGLDMVQAVLAAAAIGTAEERVQAAHRAAAAYADLTNEYQRFIAGKTFGDLIRGGAGAAAASVLVAGTTAAGLRNAVVGQTNVAQARGVAVTLDAANPYAASRAAVAVDTVVEAILAAAGGFLDVEPRIEDDVRRAAEEAGRQALIQDVARSLLPPTAPTPDYNAFVASDAFRGSGGAAAAAAAEAAVLEKVSNLLTDRDDLVRVARDAALDALRGVGQDALGRAARTTRTEFPLAGRFGPGLGDPRLTHEMATGGGGVPGAPALEGSILLPADHPTNPFRHRRHQEHGTGLDIRRNVQFAFDGEAADPLARGGFGVDRITGTYREEIFGLHKPLGPNKDIGLRVEGRFELNRVSLIDTLNAR